MKPDKAGWYWYREAGGTPGRSDARWEIVRIERREGEIVVWYSGEESEDLLGAVDGEWGAKIERPQEV